MTESKFSSKADSSSELSKSVVRHIVGSLALRVFLVCLALLVAPLLFASLFYYVSEKIAMQVPTPQGITHLLILLLFIVVFGGLSTLLITKRMARPLTGLSKAMEKVRKGELTARYQHDRMGFEINVLGRNFNQMIDSLISHMEEAKDQRLQKEMLATELKIGHEIQRSLLPREMPTFPGVEIATGFLSAKEVAGDFYDLLVKKSQQKQQLMIAIADASGKGVSACLYSLCVRSMLRSYEDSFDDLSTIMRRTNDLFCLDTGESGVFVTAWVGIYDAATRLLHFSCCGHHPALLYRKDGTIEELTTRGMALGVMPFDTVVSDSVSLHSGDRLILYTDGLLEAHDSKMHQFGKARLLEAVRESARFSAQETIDHLIKRVKEFAKRTPLHDDLTTLVIRIL